MVYHMRLVFHCMGVIALQHQQSFAELIDNTRENFNRAFENSLNAFDYPCKRLKEAVLYSCLNGGKRLRPLLVFFAGELLELDKKILMPIASAIELIHCYSLIHDDLPAMDNDELRRGKATCHIAFDEATAILAGDILQAFAIQMMLSLKSDLPAQSVLELADSLSQAMADMVSGQSLDMNGLTSKALTLEDLEKTHQLKTGKLMAACIELVINADSGGDSHKHQQLREFSHLFGLAFQIQDDYLDLYGDSQRLGKQQGSDKDNHKQTYCDFYHQAELRSLLETLYEKINSLLKLFGENNHLLQLTQFIASRDH